MFCYLWWAPCRYGLYNAFVVDIIIRCTLSCFDDTWVSKYNAMVWDITIYIGIGGD